MPSRVPPHKGSPAQASGYHRFAMAALASAGRDGLRVSDLELRSSEPSYTSLTLQRLAQAGYAPSQLYFVLGSDAFADIVQWHDYPALLRPQSLRGGRAPRTTAGKAAQRDAVAGGPDARTTRPDTRWGGPRRSGWSRQRPATSLRRGSGTGSPPRNRPPICCRKWLAPISSAMGSTALRHPVSFLHDSTHARPSGADPADHSRDGRTRRRSMSSSWICARAARSPTISWSVSGRSTRQVQAIVDAIEKRLRSIDARPDAHRGVRQRAMGADGLLRRHRPHLHAGHPGALRPGAPLGQRDAHRDPHHRGGGPTSRRIAGLRNRSG